jgi:putative oxidoreductase
MKNMNSPEAKSLVWNERVLSCLRVIASCLFCCHGVQKLFGLWGVPQMPVSSLFGIAGVIEMVGGALLLIGLFARPVSFLLCGHMAVAYFYAHAGKGFFPIANGGELAVLYCFLFLFFVFSGPGKYSLDAWFYSRRPVSG